MILHGFGLYSGLRNSDDAVVAKGLADERVLARRLVCHGKMPFPLTVTANRRPERKASQRWTLGYRRIGFSQPRNQLVTGRLDRRVWGSVSDNGRLSDGQAVPVLASASTASHVVPNITKTSFSLVISMILRTRGFSPVSTRYRPIF